MGHSSSSPQYASKPASSNVQYTPRQYTPTNTHSIAIGYVLWVFGVFGAHRDYYGRPISATLWLFTGGLLGIGWLVALFLIPGMDEDANNRYVGGQVDYTVAWLLHLFLGCLGIHRFYMGKFVTGIIFLLTGGLLGFGWIYDLFTLNEQVDDVNREGLVTCG